MRRKLSNAAIALVRMRADGLCEYCHAQEQWQCALFTIDHVLPLAKGGSNDPDNLALACPHCNRRKSESVTAYDAVLQQQVLLFNPRTNEWSQNFVWSHDGLTLIGITSTGRATVASLDFNRPRLIEIRAADQEVQRHPPADDPRQ